MLVERIFFIVRFLSTAIFFILGCGSSHLRIVLGEALSLLGLLSNPESLNPQSPLYQQHSPEGLNGRS